MNVFLMVAGLLSALIGVAHSVLGEKLVLRPLFTRGEVPKLLGSTAFAHRTLRFTWHLTTVLLRSRLPVFLLKQNDGTCPGRLEQTDFPPVILCHVVLKKSYQRISFNIPF